MSDSLYTQLTRLLDDYTQTVTDKVNNVTDKTAKALKKEIADTSPVGYRKKLKKSWRIKKEKVGGVDLRATVHSTQYRIVHLVEKGHVTRNGTSRTRAYHFMAKAVDKIIPDYEKAVEEAIENAE